MPVVLVNRKGADRILSGHLWIFSTDIINASQATPGDAVRVVGPQGRNLGTAHYSSSSKISLRLLSRRVEAPDEEFLFQRLRDAFAYRNRVVSDSDAYRLLHAEGDLLPGLIVDRYGECLVLQAVNQGMDRSTAAVTNALVRLFQPRGVLARNDIPSRAKENLKQETTVLYGDIPAQAPIFMNGLKLQADLLGGQKTGVFLDQRENYLAARRYATGSVLDCFSGTGGFALHVSSACEQVEAVDSSASALASAKANAEANGLRNIRFHQADVLDYLPNLVNAHRTYDMVVVDPPAFTKSREGIEGASRGYKEINLRALRLLTRRGILISCSCSYHMSEAHLLELIAAAAIDCGKTLRVLERRTQSLDHPILLTVPETHYLKCLILEVL